jgi:hypothetical protein
VLKSEQQAAKGENKNAASMNSLRTAFSSIESILIVNLREIMMFRCESNRNQGQVSQKDLHDCVRVP